MTTEEAVEFIFNEWDDLQPVQQGDLVDVFCSIAEKVDLKDLKTARWYLRQLADKADRYREWLKGSKADTARESDHEL